MDQSPRLIAAATPPRRFRFGLRSLFVLVTVVAVATAWVTYSLEWIRQRREAIANRVVAFDVVSGDLQTTAPHGLWLLGESGHLRCWVADDGTLKAAQGLFPEAEISVASWPGERPPIPGVEVPATPAADTEFRQYELHLMQWELLHPDYKPKL